MVMKYATNGLYMFQIENYSLLYLFLCLFLSTVGCDDKKASTDLVVESGLQVDTVASEPLVIDPVAFAYDEQGYLYVVEDRGYPDPAEGGEPKVKEGRIARLEDTDGDGQYDRRTEFATGLTYPNGIMPWRGGVFVTVAPDIFYLKDTDGDGKADVRQVVLTGFKDTRTAQIRMSHPTLGFDGWVYVTSGLNGGEVHSPLHPDRPPVTFNASDVRFHPETYEVEVVGGKSQFGQTFDRYGRRFGTWNRAPVEHIVFNPSDLNRNPYLSFNQTVKEVSKVGGEAVVFPISNATTSADYIPDLMGQSHSGTFTAASGVFVYNGSGLAPTHQGDVFIAESAQNLVQRQKMEPDGVSFSSELVYEGKEFLASKNVWFRPVYLGVGPADGLHVVDMHRKVIDHPSYVPEEVRDTMDFRAGDEMGRIYNISAEGKTLSLADRQWINDSTPISELVEWLKSDKQWDRTTAYRLLLERNDSSIIPALKKLVKNSAQPESRVRALWLLHHLEGLDSQILREALGDRKAGVREQAVRLSRENINGADSLKEAVMQTCMDPNMRVRFNCVLALGDLKGPKVAETLASVAARDGEDKWMRAAILSGISDQMGVFLKKLQDQKIAHSDAYASVMEDLGRILGRGGSRQDCRRLFQATLDAQKDYKWRISAVLGMMEGLINRQDFNQSPDNILTYLYEATLPSSVKSSWKSFLDEVMAIAETTTGNQQKRVTAIELLGYLANNQSRSIFTKALQPENAREVQLAAIEAIGRQNAKIAAQLLMDEDRWAGYTPTIRSEVVSTMMSRTEFIKVLLHAIEENIIAPAEISSVDRQQLINNDNKSIRQRAETLFAEFEGGSRKKAYQDYLSTTKGSGDPEIGEKVFNSTCSVCHTYAGQGGKVGPDLTGIKNQPKDAILLHTIMPNYEVYPSYQTVIIETNGGRSITGRIMTETDNSVTVRTASGTDETILRDNITSLSNTGTSLMPDGLEKTMTKEEMSGLLEYLKSGS